MAGWFKLSLLLIILTLGLDAKKEQRKLKLVIDTFYVKHHAPDLFEELKCVVTQANRSYLSCNMILRRSIDQAEMITNFDIIKANNQTMKLYNNRMDFCQYFTALHKVRLYREVAKSFVTRLGEMIKCPLKTVSSRYLLANIYITEIKKKM
ncbi:PREDICTED: uncharacterized protein LOC108609683 [Drosophila arizonae]|uniref:Uncharacterized protein LOC108609683 n=1 Tax=Drosophila arizonae TaxID=7263 RepID=A0ABM1NPK8_DROAR|nr:PREDICTED: uncharacterized protein LOC108609683 [Drosophila arizonae]